MSGRYDESSMDELIEDAGSDTEVEPLFNAAVAAAALRHLGAAAAGVATALEGLLAVK